MLVTRYNRADNTTTWTLRDINTVKNFFGRGKDNYAKERRNS
jgi:hypothetical protein